jgi:hypothetical protein
MNNPVSPDARGHDPAARGFIRNAVQEPFLVAGKDGISMGKGPTRAELTSAA